MSQTLWLYLDDIRIPEESAHFMNNQIYLDERWVVVCNYEQFTQKIKEFYATECRLPDVISFDHDLADAHYDPSMFKDPDAYNKLYDSFAEKTGYDCVKWLVQFSMDNKYLPLPPRCLVHTMNPVGRKNITSYLANYMKFLEKMTDK